MNISYTLAVDTHRSDTPGLLLIKVGIWEAIFWQNRFLPVIATINSIFDSIFILKMNNCHYKC